MVAWMGTMAPKFNPPTEEYPVPGPKRQLAGTVFGVTMGVVEVGLDAAVGEAVELDSAVGEAVLLDTAVGVFVGPSGDGVSEGVITMTGAMNMLKEVGRSGFEATGIG